MPTMFRYLGYRMYFWSNENNEGVHLHICKGEAVLNATKIALGANGGVNVVSNKSKINQKDLNKLSEYIDDNRDIVIKCWNDYHGYLKFDF